MSERCRLIASARKKDKLTTIFPIKEIEDFSKDLYDVTFYIIYDQRKLNEDHASNFFNQILPAEKYFNAVVKRESPIKNEINVVAIRIDAKNPREILDIITQNERELNFASQLCIFAYKDEKISKKFIVGLERYYKWLDESHQPSLIKQINKSPYRGKTTVESEKEKNQIKKILINYFNQDHTSECLLKDAQGKVGFEKLVLPGKEDHIHWRRKTNHKYEEVRPKSKKDLIDLVEKEDAFSFYSSVNEEVYYFNQKIKIQHKFVREYDPPPLLNKNKKFVAEISDKINSLFKKLGIPSIYLFSGSKSARSQCFIDYEDVLENLPRIDREHPFIGYAYEEKPTTTEKLYKNVVRRGFYKALEFLLIEELGKEKLLVRELNGKPVPNITFNPQGDFRSISMFVDKPSNDSISVGSPKLIKRSDEKIKDFLGWKEDFILLVCKPIEKCPTSEEEILKEFNILNASDYFEKNCDKILDEIEERKITSEIMEKIFDRVGEDEKKFLDFCTLSEEKFFEKHYKLKF